jgi:hypothetical protein
MVVAFQILSFAALALLLFRWQRGLRKRRDQSWESLLTRLRRDGCVRDLNAQFLWKEGLTVTPEDAWQRMEGPKGLWLMYQNAQVMQEMADFADRNGMDVDRILVETLHSDAVQIRICVLMAMLQYGFNAASEGVCVYSFRTAALYSGMAARMTQLLQENYAGILPDFVESM